MKYKVVYFWNNQKHEIHVADLQTAYTIADGFRGIVLNAKAVAR